MSPMAQLPAGNFTNSVESDDAEMTRAESDCESRVREIDKCHATNMEEEEEPEHEQHKANAIQRNWKWRRPD